MQKLNELIEKLQDETEEIKNKPPPAMPQMPQMVAGGMN